MSERAPDRVRLCLAGDVMTGRGIDQILPHPSPPQLHEGYVRDARDYVRLAERRNGPIPQPVDPAYPWGDAAEALARLGPDLRLANLETAITTSDEPWPGKAVHYRMHPRNAPCLRALELDGCALANNHLLDWGPSGLLETLSSLSSCGIATAGAGSEARAAERPAAIALPAGGRLLLFAYGAIDSGIPTDWAAGEDRPGVNLLPDFSEAALERILAAIRAERRSGDLVGVSLHWGGNWGYEVPGAHRRFAHGLIEGGADFVHGHSSHHPMPLEVHHERPILYGCGDLINDYEGISGHEAFHPELTLVYLIDLDAASGRLLRLFLLPLEIRRLQLRRAGMGDAQWLAERLGRLSGAFGTGLEHRPSNGVVELQW